MSNPVDIAWCAGFFDGEGHVSYTRSIPHKNTGHVSGSLHASIPQNTENIEVLEFFQSTIGFGVINGPYAMPGSSKTQHRLIYGVHDVEKLFTILRPYLKAEKTGDFQRALAGYWTHDPKPTAEDYRKARKRADKKGEIMI